MRFRRVLALVVLAPLLLVAGFGLYLLGLAGDLPGQVEPTPSSAGITPFAELAGSESATIESTPAATASLATPGAGDSAYVIVGDQSIVRYIVREKLAGVAVDSDAVGETNAITGQITVDSAGNPVPGLSFQVDLRLLQSDKVRRDNDVKKLFLETDKFPMATFVFRQVTDLSGPLRDGAMVHGSVTGDLTAHGVTRSVTWDTTVEQHADTLTGHATTSFPFADFGMSVPNIYGMVSARDPITLEVAFTAKRMR
jgi:polyisoprenoid-binding protein YceI